MFHNPKFDLAAQTPEQRAWVLAQMKQMIPGLSTTSTATQQLYARYIAGELRWSEVCQARSNKR